MRAIIELSDSEKENLKKLKSKEKNNKIYRRYIYLELSNKGLTNLEISKVLGVCNDTLTDWRILFKEGGLEAISQLNYTNQGQVSRLEKVTVEIKEKQESEGISSLKDLQYWLKNSHNIETCISNIFYFCKKNSIFLIKKQD